MRAGSGAVPMIRTGGCGRGAGKAQPMTMRTSKRPPRRHHVDEVAPVEVGSAPRGRHVRAVAVAAVAQLDLGPGQLGRHAVDDAHHRAPARWSMKYSVSNVARLRLGSCSRGRRWPGSRPGRRRSSPPCRSPARLVQFGVGQEDYPVVDFIVHQCCSKICLAVRASMVMWPEFIDATRSLP